MRRARLIAATALVASTSTVAGALAVQARADEPSPSAPLSLVWNAPIACPDEASVRANVASLLAGSSALVDARADVRRRGEKWQVVVVMNGGERRLEADSCHALAEATALIVAMAVDPARVAANRVAHDAGVPLPVPDSDAASDAALVTPADAGPSPDGALSADSAAADTVPTSVATSNPPPTSPLSPPPSPAATAPSPARFAVGASAAVDLGTLPTPAVGPSLAFAWTPWPLRIDLSASYFPSSKLPIPGPTVTVGGSPTAGGTAYFWLLDATLRACYVARPAAFELGPCAGAQVGYIQGSSQGINATGAGGGPLLGFDAGLLAAWHFAPAWALLARGDAVLQGARQAFQVTAEPGATDGVLVSHRSGLVTGRASVGVELRF